MVEKKRGIRKIASRKSAKEFLLRSEENFSLKVEYKKAIIYLKSIKKYIYTVLFLFFLFAIIGFFLGDLVNILYSGIFGGNLNESILAYIEKLLLETDGMGTREIIGFIFLNNFQSSLMSLVFGAYFAIMPLVAIISNGYLLGFVALLSVKESGVFVLWRLFPHGIFELPAVFISLAAGLKIGDYLVRDSRKFWRGIFYLVGVGVSSVVGFAVIIGLFNLVSVIVGSGPTFSYSPSASYDSIIIFMILITIFLINMLVWLVVFEDKQRNELKKIILNSLRIFLLVVFPLLIVAAIIEGLLIVLSI